MTRKTIKYSNIPTSLPLTPTATLYLLMDKFHSPQWLWGAIGLLVLVVWISAIYNIATEESVDVISKIK